MPTNCADCKLCRLNQRFILNCPPSSTLAFNPSPLPLIVPTQKPTNPAKMIKLTPVQLNPTDRALRLISISTWVPAFVFLLPHGVKTGDLCPVLGIIPMSISACYGLVHVLNKAHSRAGNFIMDLFVGAFLLGILIPSWVFLAEGQQCRWCRYNAGLTMLGSYGTMMMMVNLCIHAFFVLRTFSLHNPFKLKTCPHCYRELRSSGVVAAAAAVGGRPASYHSHDSKESYHSLQQQDDAAAQEAGVIPAPAASAAGSPESGGDEYARPSMSIASDTQPALYRDDDSDIIDESAPLV